MPNYLTLALNYAPPSSKQLRYKLLCRRSFAYHEIDDFQQAVEDGVNATKIQPDDVEVRNILVQDIAIANCCHNVYMPRVLHSYGT